MFRIFISEIDRIRWTSWNLIFERFFFFFSRKLKGINYHNLFSQFRATICFFFLYRRFNQNFNKQPEIKIIIHLLGKSRSSRYLQQLADLDFEIPDSHEHWMQLAVVDTHFCP